MRVIWKDSATPERKPRTYRGYLVTGCEGGWVSGLPGDNNIYKSRYGAENAIDAALGGTGRKSQGSAKRRAHGIQIAGKLEA